MAGTRTPTRVLEARNAFKKHPERRRDGEPEVKEPLGAPPDCLDPIEVQAWQLIASEVPTGVLTQADRIELEMAARLLVKVRTDFDNVNITALRHLHTVLGKFGMNPADRARLSIEKPPSEDPYAFMDE